MLVIGRSVKRNLQEQVGENMKQIDLIWQKLDGLDVYDNVIIIEDLSNLNEEQLAIVARPVSFIVYQDIVYVKKGNVGAYALFSSYYSIETDEYITIKSSELRVQFPLGEVTISGVEVELYDKDETDTLLGYKADKSNTFTKAETLLACYPVGAIYMSTVATSPASLFGGTWEALNNGNQVIIPFDIEAPTKTITTEIPSASRTNVPLRFYNITTQGTITDSALLGLNTGDSNYQSGSLGTEYGKISPVNLYADLSNSVRLYMWKRIG